MKQCVNCLSASRKFMIQLGGRSYIIFSVSLVHGFDETAEVNKNVSE